MSELTNDLLIKELAQIIEQDKRQAVAQVNSIMTMVYWQVGYKVNTHILQNERAEYGRGLCRRY